MIQFNWEYGSLLATLTMVIASFTSCASAGCSGANLSPAQTAARRDNLNTNADFIDRIVDSAQEANATVVGEVEVDEPRGELYQGLRLGGVKAKLFVFMNPAASQPTLPSLPSVPSESSVSSPSPSPSETVTYPATIPTEIVKP